MLVTFFEDIDVAAIVCVSDRLFASEDGGNAVKSFLPAVNETEEADRKVHVDAFVCCLAK